MTTADWIKHRRELLDAATEAPWTPEDVYGLVAPTKIDGYHATRQAAPARGGVRRRVPASHVGPRRPMQRPRP